MHDFTVNISTCSSWRCEILFPLPSLWNHWTMGCTTAGWRVLTLWDTEEWIWFLTDSEFITRSVSLIGNFVKSSFSYRTIIRSSILRFIIFEGQSNFIRLKIWILWSNWILEKFDSIFSFLTFKNLCCSM